MTLQELLAARKIAKIKPNDLSDLITLNFSDAKWHLVIQFVAGLLGGQEPVESVDSYISILCDSVQDMTEGFTLDEMFAQV